MGETRAAWSPEVCPLPYFNALGGPIHCGGLSIELAPAGDLGLGG
jgi:hypothetical protein